MSADTAEVQQRFIDKFSLTFPLLPDPHKHIIEAYGAREVLGIAAKRSTFLIAPDGTVAWVWPHVAVEGHAADVIQRIRALTPTQ